MVYPSSSVISEPALSLSDQALRNQDLMVAPLPPEEARVVPLVKGPNIASLPRFDSMPDTLELPVLLKAGDNISTDEILPAGAKVLPFRSNIPKISEFAFNMVDPSYAKRARELPGKSGHCVVAGSNYGQGSSREHAALAPRFLGLRIVIARSFARIHMQNLINFGILPLVFENEADLERIQQGDILTFRDIPNTLRNSATIIVRSARAGDPIVCRRLLSGREMDITFAGGVINLIHRRKS
jgi:aconitate hydratase